MLISGFNTLPEREREKYDKARMSRDQRNLFFLWCVVFLIGGALSYFVNTYCAIPAFAVWLVLFFREVHIDTERLLANTVNEFLTEQAEIFTPPDG